MPSDCRRLQAQAAGEHGASLCCCTPGWCQGQYHAAVAPAAVPAVAEAVAAAGGKVHVAHCVCHAAASWCQQQQPGAGEGSPLDWAWPPVAQQGGWQGVAL